MAVTSRLSRSLHHALGDGPADDFVNWMGHVEANRSELRELMDLYQSRTDAKFAAMDARMDAGFARLELAITRLEGKFDAKFEQVDAKMERKFAELLKWSFVFWAGTVGAVVALVQTLK